MASNLKRSKRTVGKRVNDVSRRVSRLEKNPSPRRIGSRTIVSGNLDPAVVTDIATGVDVAVDFYANNNQNATVPTAPTVNNDGSAITHIINTDSTATITFNWNYTVSDTEGAANNIDGFVIYVYQSTSSSPYDPVGDAAETTYFAARDKKSFLLIGAPADKYFTFGVKAYRVVDSNIDTAGVKYSAVAKSTFAGENPFRPSASVAFAGDVTGTVGGTSATNVYNATTNFNANNDQNATTPTAPTISSDGTAVDHVLNTDASADISFEWTYTTSTTQGAANNIDGFAIYVYSSTSATPVTLGSAPATADKYTVYYVNADRRAFILSGVSPDLYYTFGIRAYRVVDSNIGDNSGVIYNTTIIQPSLAGENPYQPSATVAFTGNIGGTLATSTPASNVYNATTNFNTNNDQFTSTPSTPTSVTLTTGLQNTNATIDLKTTWAFTTSTVDNGGNIDGFTVYLRTIQPVLIDSLSASGSVVTYTTKSAHGFVAGNSVTVSGISPAGYSGTFTVLASPAPTTNTFAVTNATTGAATYTNPIVYSATLAATDITTADLNTDIQQVNLTAEKRSHTFSGVSPNSVYKVAIRAYRVVDKNVNADGILFGSLANSSSVTPTTPSLGGDSAIYVANGKIYIGAGNYGNTDTGFYVDNGGFFSLKDKLTFNPSTNLLTVKGRIESTAGTIGAFTIGTVDLTATGIIAPSPFGSTATISIGTNGEIKSRRDLSYIGGSTYTEAYLNKYGDTAGLTVTGNADGSLVTTYIYSARVVSPEAYCDVFRHKSGGQYHSDTTWTSFGYGVTQPGSFRVVNIGDVYSQTITSGRTVLINSNGTIGGVSSSIRFKENVENLSINYKDVLKIEPVTFYYKEDVCEPDDYFRDLNVGVIAEQVESIGGLEELLIYDDGVLNSFRYEKLPVYLLEVCRVQETVIESLKEKVAALEAAAS